MIEGEIINLGELFLKKGKSVNPEKFKEENFDLLSIPAYDRGIPDIAFGKEIGSSKKLLESGDVIISRIIPHIRRCWVVPISKGRRQIGSSEWIVFRSDRFDSKFLKYYLLSDLFNGMFMRTVRGVGGSLLRANPKLVEKFKILLPSLKIQKKIAAILDEADRLRCLNRDLVEKYDELLSSVLLEALGDSINKDKKFAKLGTRDFLPKGYKWVLLKDICNDIADIDHNMPKAVDNGKIFLSAKDLSNDGELDFSKAKMISEKDFKHLSRKIKPQNGDIIYSRIGAKLGKARLVNTDKDFIVSYSCCTIKPKHDLVSNIYLRYYLDSEQVLRQASHGTRGIGVPDLGMNEVRNFKIALPPKEIMQQISKKIETIKTQKTQAQAALQKSEDLFNSLLQKAFKGELTAVSDT